MAKYTKMLYITNNERNANQYDSELLSHNRDTGTKMKKKN